MCGIVGYIGHRKVVPILLNGLQRVEYRGYDSAGIAIPDQSCILIRKSAGKIKDLRAILKQDGLTDRSIFYGIAHTRWGTHGLPTDINAHPHIDSEGQVAIVHNGIIENFDDLRKILEKEGCQFSTETDTEVLAQLIGKCLNGDPLEAVRSALQEVQGTYGLAAIFRDHPGIIIFARHGSPLCIGLGEDEWFVASDAQSFRQYTNQQIVVEEHQIGILSSKGYQIRDMNNVAVSPLIEKIEWTVEEAEKGHYDHFMLKEICEQPVSLTNSMRGRVTYGSIVTLGGLSESENVLKSVTQLTFMAAGTSLYAAMIGRILLQEISGLPAYCENASELANQENPCFPERSAFWAISQSGETADLLRAMERVKSFHYPVFGLCNVVGSSVARQTQKSGGVYIHAGPEIGVASTKAFTSQVLVLNLISMYLRELKGIRKEAWIAKYFKDLGNLTAMVQEVVDQRPVIQQLAKKYCQYKNFLFLGRGINYPVALEGALKLKEISYIHAEGYPTGEMKHGPLAMICEDFPTVVIVPRKDNFYKKIISNIQEIKVRKGPVIAIANEGDEEIASYVDDVIYIPSITYYLTPILFVVPLQLFAYYVAVELGHNVDQPRHLAKSVTVE